MRILSWLFYIALFVLALAFALSNTDPVDVRFFAGQATWRAPVVVVLLSFLAAGVVLGLIACIPTFFRQRREIAGLRKELKALGRPATGGAGVPAADAAASRGGVPSTAGAAGAGGSTPPLGV
ncbi:MAG: LapA family protein [Betaproteobacteria bacterium]|nr:LapA family protein [Betaproteobacteria bacterium]